MSKTPAFEYFVFKITEWNEQQRGSKTFDLDKLKIIKLHFFACAVLSNPEKIDLFHTFDNFHALPLGPVESDVYNSINRRELNFFEIGKNRFEISTEYILPAETDLNFQTRGLIEDSIDALKKINPKLIEYSAFQLVDLSHLWASWISIFSYAKSFGKYSERIPVDIIRKEHKIFSL